MSSFGALTLLVGSWDLKCVWWDVKPYWTQPMWKLAMHCHLRRSSHQSFLSLITRHIMQQIQQ